MPYGQQVDDSNCNMPCAGNNMELCGASLLLALYQDGDATPLDPQACFPFNTNIELQAIAKQGPQNPVQISSQTLVPHSDSAAQVVTFSVRTPLLYSPSPLEIQPIPGLPAPLQPLSVYNRLGLRRWDVRVTFHWVEF
jgi:hypothetical protein